MLDFTIESITKISEVIQYRKSTNTVKENQKTHPMGRFLYCIIQLD